MRPTARTVLIFAAGIPLALLIVIYNPALWLLSLNYGILVLLAAGTDLLLSFPPRLLDIQVSVPERLHIGERSTINATISTTAWRRPTRFELIVDQLGDLDQAQVVAGNLQPGAELRIALPIVPRRRGRVSIDRLWVRWRGPLGLCEYVRNIALDRTIDVLPNVRGVQSAALQFVAQEALYGIKTQQQSGEGSEFEALREYTPGLDSRFIDWKHSARHRKLLCKEFRTERNHQIIMAFDTGYLMLEPVDAITRLDHAINAGLILAWISLHGGDLVGTYGFDATVRQYLGPIRGISSFARIQRATAELGYQLYPGSRRAQRAAQAPCPRHPVHRFRRHDHRRASHRKHAADCEPTCCHVHHPARLGAAARR